ncbi:MAG TPA: SDR family oxidoreductase [Kofleriaceae bacterium]|nr:SDR family oxidoreductase [Kofleriaceae bacterium]
MTGPAGSGATPPIAVVGIGGIFPGSIGIAAFYRDLLEGRDRLTEVPPTHWRRDDYFDPRPMTPDKVPTTRGGFLPDVEFAPLEFGIPPNALPATDSAQLLALVVAKQVLREATRDRWESIDRSRISVVLGVASATELVAHMSGRLQIPVVERALRSAGLGDDAVGRVRDALARCYVPWQEDTFPGLLGNVVAGRIANRLDLGGTNLVIDAACASSLAAVDAAINELALGRADLAITGGVDTINDILMYMCFAQTGALSPTGDCRPFSSDADGTMLGEGIGMLALRRLADAERDGDAIYAVIRGIGGSSDGRAKSIYAPSASGQAVALRRAYERAGYGPETVELVEAHGTGTAAGDAAELAALREVFAAAGAAREGCALGSVKSQIGHTKAAAGSASLLKAVTALHHGVLPPTIKVTAPAAALAGSPFYLNTRTRPWIRGGGHPRRAAVSALGFGGTNFHLTVEEYRGPAPRPARLRAMPSELVLVAAGDAGALAAACRRMAADGGGDLAARARRSQCAFDPAAGARLAVVAGDVAELASKLTAAAEQIDRRPDGFSSPRGIHVASGPPAGALALVFPGQGSQYPGMGGDLAVHFACALAAWDDAARVDPGIAARAHPPPRFASDAAAEPAARDERALTATEWAQPAIAAASLATLRVLERFGVAPAMVAGHSLGEVTALGAAGALDRSEVVAIARRRGELIAGAAREPGAMLAVTGELAAVEQAIARAGAGVVIANHNAPSQVVLSGAVAAIAEIARSLAAAGLDARAIPVSAAFHSPLVSDACPGFRRLLDDRAVAAPRVPVYANATAAPYPQGAAAIRDQLAAAIAARVRFAEQIEAMYAAGARVFVEVGPSGILTRLVGRCLGDRAHLAVATDVPDRHGVTALWDALGRLATAGVALDFERYWRDEPAGPAEAARPPALRVRISGANYGKPIAPAGEPAAAQAPGQAVAPAMVVREAASPAPVAPHRAPDAAVAGAGLDAVRAALVAVQMDYQRVMAESHLAFLRAYEAAHLSAGVSAAVMAPPPSPGVSAVMAPLPSPGVSAVMAPPPPDSIAVMASYPDTCAWAAAPAHIAVAPARAVESFAAPPQSSSPSSPSPSPPLAGSAVAPVAAPATTPAELERLLLAVVAECTGYPAELVELTMDLESDLGIDSIKRVEILSVTRDRAPWLPEIDAARMSKLRTLREILALFEPAAPPANPTAPAAVPAPEAAPPRTAPRARNHHAVDAAVTRWLPRAVAAPPSGLALAGLDRGRLAVTDDGAGVAAALVAELAAEGLDAEVVGAVPANAAGVVFLGGLRDVATPEDAIAVHREALAAARAVAARFAERGGCLVTVGDLGGDFGLSGRAGARAWLGGLGALCKTAAHEWPLAAVRAIDLARGAASPVQLARRIARELLEGGVEIEVGLGEAGERVAIVSEPAPPLGAGTPIEPGAFLVASGGARGITAACLEALARRVPVRLLLLGRSELEDEAGATSAIVDPAELRRAVFEHARGSGSAPSPRDIAARVDRILASREVRRTLAALTAAGSEVHSAAVDVRDRAAVGAAIDEARRRWGPVRGLVHGAGVVADARIADKTDEQLERVLATKLRGLAALLDATRADPLAWIAVFSSVAARAGNAGQADYAMANEVLNKVAAAEARRRGDGCRVVAIGWGPWDGGMVGPALRDRFAARGVELLPPAAGGEAFVDELAGVGSVEIVVARSPVLDRRVARPIAADVLVDRRRWPQLDSHRIQGKVVLPVAIVLEWFVRLAWPLRHGREVIDERSESPLSIELSDVRVVRGVTLAGYDEGATERLHLVGQPAGDGRIAVELRDRRGAVRFTAAIGLGAAGRGRPTARVPDGEPPREPWDGPALYGPASLFHGPQFRVVRSVDAISRDRARGTLAATGAGWTAGAPIDPAAIDGAFQLAMLFGLRGGGGPRLPLRIERLVFHHRPDGEDGELRCELTERSRSQERLLCDLSLASASGEPVADLLGVEMFAVPSGSTAG